jgi:hypothetical protein
VTNFRLTGGIFWKPEFCRLDVFAKTWLNLIARRPIIAMASRKTTIPRSSSYLGGESSSSASRDDEATSSSADQLQRPRLDVARNYMTVGGGAPSQNGAALIHALEEDGHSRRAYSTDDVTFRPGMSSWQFNASALIDRPTPPLTPGDREMAGR